MVVVREKHPPASKTNTHCSFSRLVVGGGGKTTTSLENERALVFESGRWWWWWQRGTTIKTERTRSVSRVEGGDQEEPPSKPSAYARFRGWKVVEKRNHHQNRARTL